MCVVLPRGNGGTFCARREFCLTEVLFFDVEGAERSAVQRLVVGLNVCTRQPMGKGIFVSSDRMGHCFVSRVWAGSDRRWD